MKLNCDILLSNSAFKFNLRRYNKDAEAVALRRHDGVLLRLKGDGKRYSVALRDDKVGPCRLTVSKTVLKAPMVFALEATI